MTAVAWSDALAVSTALGAAVVAGIFFAFSTFVMKALGRLPPAHGIAAMQSINTAVLNPWFFAVFFGTALGAAVLGLLGLLSWGTSESAFLFAGSVLYLIGCIVVTIGLNVPLNNELAVIQPGATQSAETWARYLSLWTTWNHLRTVASLAAAASFLAT
ncbi:MAG: DUF1772 domain-containing protein [Alphaproteobacteria bacterium]|nr:MAG: DUF1772 domain-containing protein [Alphaproteobacteria bacterium]